MHSYRYIFASLLIAASGSAMAQQLHENVSVEGTYRPDVIHAERFNLYPERKDFPIEARPLDYDLDGVTAEYLPIANPLGIYGWGTNRKPLPKGYLDLSLGSWLNSSLSAGYAAIDTPDTRLDISLQHNSTSLWNPYSGIGGFDNHRFRYDESIAARFCHNFTGKGLLEAQLQYHLGYFNYYSYLPSTLAAAQEATPAATFPKAPTQTLNDLAFKAGWSAKKGDNLFWNAGAGVRYFGYRSLYLPDYLPDTDGLFSMSGDRETLVNLNGGVKMDWNNGSILGIDAKADILLYSGKSDLKHTRPSNYGNVELHPFYRFTRDNFIINIGAKIDLTFNADGDYPSSEHYSLFHIAPDVRVDWRKDAFGLYLHLGGGSELQTLALRSQQDYYGMPALTSTQPLYTPLDGRLGFEFGPFRGFRAGIEAAYRASLHSGYQGWYMALLNYGDSPMPQLDIQNHTPLYSLWTTPGKLHGFHLKANISYSSGKIWKLHASAAYMPQKEEKGWMDGIDRPRWILDAGVEVAPISKLKIGVGYEYRGVRTIWTPTAMNPESSSSVTINGKRPLASMRLADICNLKAEASWNLTEKMAIGVTAENILNHRIDALPCLPTEGIDIQGTLSFRF